MPSGQELRPETLDLPEPREFVGFLPRDPEVVAGQPAPPPGTVDPDESPWDLGHYKVHIQMFYHGSDPRFLIEIGCQKMILDSLDNLYEYIKETLYQRYRAVSKCRSEMKAMYVKERAELKK